MTSKEAVDLFKQYQWRAEDKNKALEILEKIVARDTAKKVEIATSYNTKWPICPNCKIELNEYYKTFITSIIKKSKKTK